MCVPFCRSISGYSSHWIREVFRVEILRCWNFGWELVKLQKIPGERRRGSAGHGHWKIGIHWQTTFLSNLFLHPWPTSACFNQKCPYNSWWPCASARKGPRTMNSLHVRKDGFFQVPKDVDGNRCSIPKCEGVLWDGCRDSWRDCSSIQLCRGSQDEIEQFTGLRKFLMHNNIDPDLSIRVTRFLKHSYGMKHKALSRDGNVAILEMLSKSLHEELQLQRHSECLQESDFLQMLSFPGGGWLQTQSQASTCVVPGWFAMVWRSTAGNLVMCDLFAFSKCIDILMYSAHVILCVDTMFICNYQFPCSQQPLAINCYRHILPIHGTQWNWVSSVAWHSPRLGMEGSTISHSSPAFVNQS